jgi:tetratricopeptide (TPR) repeat protein
MTLVLFSMPSHPAKPKEKTSRISEKAVRRLIALATILTVGALPLCNSAQADERSKTGLSKKTFSPAAPPNASPDAKADLVDMMGAAAGASGDADKSASGDADKSASGAKGAPGAKSGASAPVALDAKVDPKGVLNQALKAYQSGKYGQAAALLANDLQANPDDGTVHYYMGLALKKQGYDMKALHELEKAARLCPPEMVKKFADEQIGNLDEPEPLGPAPTTPPASGGDWWSGFGNSISQMFGGKPAAPATAAKAGAAGAGAGAGAGTNGSGTAAGSSSPAFPPISFFGMPDMMAPIKDAIKQGKKMLRDQKNNQGGNGGGDGGRRHGGGDYTRQQVGEAEIMHMDEMQDLVNKSHKMNVPDWASAPTGVVAFEQAPEGTPEWDYWIGRFKRSFQHVLMRRLNSEASDQVRGAAACIFSVDRAGNLRGQVYASTADPALNKCLVEAIRDLNHSRILAFPVTSHITGWNFQMSWNFGVYLAIVKRYKEQKEREETVQALLHLAKEETDLKATMLAADQEKRAKAKKLAAEKAAKAKLLKALPEANTEVAGRVLTPGSEREMKAVALELKDLTPVGTNASQPNVDPFASIDDQTINSWPDLNR